MLVVALPTAHRMSVCNPVPFTSTPPLHVARRTSAYVLARAWCNCLLAHVHVALSGCLGGGVCVLAQARRSSIDPPCLKDFWLTSVKNMIKNVRNAKHPVSLQSMTPLIKSRRAVELSSMCTVHGRLCPMEKAQFHWAGIPCVAMSPMGRRDGTDAECMSAWAAWAALRLRLQEPVIVVECSDKLDAAVLRSIFDDDYILEARILRPLQLGWVGRRRRFWGVLIHRSLIQEAFTTLSDNFIACFSRRCTATWHEFMFDTADNINKDILWAAKRNKSCAKGKAEMVLTGDRPAFSALTEAEKTYLARYKNIRPHGLYMLNQNPAAGRGMMSSEDGAIYTLIKNNCINWDDDADRWLTPKEVLSLQGFPVEERLANPVGRPRALTSFLFNRVRQRNRNHVLGQAGNSMNTMVCGLIWIYTVIFLRPKESNAWERAADVDLITALKTAFQASTTSRTP